MGVQRAQFHFLPRRPRPFHISSMGRTHPADVNPGCLEWAKFRSQDVGVVRTQQLVLQMRKLRPRDVKRLAQGCTAS